MNSLQAKKEEKEKEVSILQKDVNLVEISYLQLEDITNRLQELHSKASLAAQGLSEKDILDEQVVKSVNIYPESWNNNVKLYEVLTWND